MAYMNGNYILTGVVDDTPSEDNNQQSQQSTDEIQNVGFVISAYEINN